MGSFYLISIVISAIVSIIIFELSKLKKKVYKYIPSMLLLLASIILMILAHGHDKTWYDFGRSIGYLVNSILSFITFVITLLVAITFDIIKKIREKK